MNNNVSDIKPWFRDDLARTLMSIYFASKSAAPSGAKRHLPQMEEHNLEEAGYRNGFAAALASVALAVGVNPESFLSPEDLQALRKVQR